MGMKIIRLADAAFVGDDGQEVHGMYVYLVPTGAGVSLSACSSRKRRCATSPTRPRSAMSCLSFAAAAAASLT